MRSSGSHRYNPDGNLQQPQHTLVIVRNWADYPNGDTYFHNKIDNNTIKVLQIHKTL